MPTMQQFMNALTSGRGEGNNNDFPDYVNTSISDIRAAIALQNEQRLDFKNRVKSGAYLVTRPNRGITFKSSIFLRYLTDAEKASFISRGKGNNISFVDILVAAYLDDRDLEVTSYAVDSSSFEIIEE